MVIETREKRAGAVAAVASAAKAYADAATGGRPLAAVETQLLESVGSLIGKPVTVAEAGRDTPPPPVPPRD